MVEGARELLMEGADTGAIECHRWDYGVGDGVVCVEGVICMKMNPFTSV